MDRPYEPRDLDGPLTRFGKGHITMKKSRSQSLRIWLGLGLGLFLIGAGFGCSRDEGNKNDLPTAHPEDSEAPVSDLDSLMEGTPTNDEIPADGKADAIYPTQFDLVDYQSPVRSQGSRGVCSIFSTVGLMEHLYIKEGTMPDPDFSEQFLQWSVKMELGDFTHTGGSTARSNIRAIHRYGIVTEEIHPYEPYPWDTSDDERCEGDEQPTICYTNGEPPETALDARRWKLPSGRYVNSRPRSIKAFLVEHDQAVTAGMTFFYQSWNHRSSSLPVNSEYWSEGYVVYPNDTDKEKSLEKRAGHSILIVGWDDELEVERVDENGDVMTDEEGNPITEKGFWLFKNSWGTSGFGIRNPFGAGYGWLSMRYVEEYASVYGSDEPDVDIQEICDDGLDNDFDGDVDCDDQACAEDPVCIEDGLAYQNDETLPIPDDDAEGIVSTIEVDQPGTIGNVFVELDITHSYIGDLTVTLVGPDGTRVVLHNREGGSENDIKGTYSPVGFVGKSIQGTWTLEITDTANADTGTLNGWSLTFQLTGDVPAEVCDDGIDNDGNGLADCADDACVDFAGCGGTQTVIQTNDAALDIPDNDENGVESTIEITEAGEIADLAVDVDITHTFRADLIVKLRHPEGHEITLFNQEGLGEENLVRRFTPADFDGMAAAGIWTLTVIDWAGQDVGTLNSWTLEMEVL
jgi:subtilisin-like proprotein convertase family protein/C1A family cysteine protease